MELQFFLVFVGCLLLCAIILAVAIKIIAAALLLNGKKLFWAGFAAAIFTSLAAYLISFVSTDAFKVFWLLGSLFLLSGIVYTSFFRRRVFHFKKISGRLLLAEVFFGLSVLFFASAVFSSLQYFFKDEHFLFYPVLMSALLFFVPLFVVYCFGAAYGIPVALYPAWQYPLQSPPEYPDDIGREKILVIGLKLAKEPTDSSKTYFRAKTPETMKLGDFFYHFINDYNDLHRDTPIAYVDAGFEAYGWLFYEKRKWYQADKILNPEFSVRENGIRENTVIVCERILNAVHLSNTYNNSYHERQA